MPAPSLESNGDGRRVVLVDDHTVFRRALTYALRVSPGRYHVREEASASTLLVAVDTFEPELVCLDLALPGVDGRRALRMLRAVSPVPVLILSGYVTPREAPELIAAGATGLLPKSASLHEVLHAVEWTLAGGLLIHPSLTQPIRSQLEEGFRRSAGVEPTNPLSEREAEVLELASQGRGNMEIAAALTLSTRTVERHKRTASQKLGLGSARHLPLWLAQQSVRRELIRTEWAA